MSVWTKLDPKGNFYPQVLWQGTSAYNPDLKVVLYKGIVRIISGGFTQSKKLDHLTAHEGYWQAQINARDISKIPHPRVLILGLGGGTMVHLFQQKNPDVEIDGVEIDKQMVELGKKYLGLTDKGLTVHVADAADFVRSGSDKYDLVCVDTFAADSIPNRCDREEFYQDINRLLAKEGVVAINRIFEKKGFWKVNNNPRLLAFKTMLSSVFDQVTAQEIPSDYNSKNYIFKGVKVES